MIKEENLSKFIYAVPILFIILTTIFITSLHIKKADTEFKINSLKLKDNLLKEERQKLNTIFNSIDSFIYFKKNTSLNILKNKIKSRVEFTSKVLTRIYNDRIGIESSSSIQISLLSSLSNIQSKEKGRYFLIGYDGKNNEFLNQLNHEKFKDNKIYSNKQFLERYNILLKNNQEGFIFYKEKNKANNFTSKIAYVKKLETLNIVIGYNEYIEPSELKAKEETLKRLSLTKIRENVSIFTYDSNLDVIQHSNPNFKLGDKIDKIEENKQLKNEILKFRIIAKSSKNNDNFKYFWKEEGNNYKLFIFNYVKGWDWLIGICTDIINIDNKINKIIGQDIVKRNQTIKDSSKVAFIFIILASVLSYLISKIINDTFCNYKSRLETKNKELENINTNLEIIVDEKTHELENLNAKLKTKFRKEVLKNRKKDRMIYTQSKMASMGEMIGNIAHQWRQPLNTISTIASGNNLKLEFGLVHDDSLKKDFSKIVETTKHLSNTIEDFRNFFIKDKDIKIFDLVDLMNKNLSLISASMNSSNILIVKNFMSVEISGIKNELLQAILNILNNARDALVERKDKNRIILIDIYEEQKKAYIVITDNAGGISEDIINKVFDSYFTTKDRAKGTGIGLYMTKEIIENHMNGKIEVYNETFTYEKKSYMGACFKISLPIKYI